MGGNIAGFDQARRWYEHQLPTATASTTIPAAHLHVVWRSIATLLRPGDVISLHWRADDRSDTLPDPALHRDELRLGVARGTRGWLFLLDVQVRPEPNRMITFRTVAAATDGLGAARGPR